MNRYNLSIDNLENIEKSLSDYMDLLDHKIYELKYHLGDIEYAERIEELKKIVFNEWKLLDKAIEKYYHNQMNGIKN